MTPAELQAATAELGLSQLALGRMVDVNARTVRRWFAGDAPIPGAVSVLLRLALAVRRREGGQVWAELLREAAAVKREG